MLVSDWSRQRGGGGEAFARAAASRTRWTQLRQGEGSCAARVGRRVERGGSGRGMSESSHGGLQIFFNPFFRALPRAFFGDLLRGICEHHVFRLLAV